MTSFSAKLLDAFRNLRSDAVPRSPRPDNRESANDVCEENYNNENETINDNYQEDLKDSGDHKTNDKPNYKKNVFGSKKKGTQPNTEKKKKNTNNGIHGNNVNTQATGYVINIVDSTKVRCGNDFVYYLGPTNGQPTKQEAKSDDSDEEFVEKTNQISLLMEAEMTPEHEYIDYVSKNLGRNWHSFFRKLGYTKGRIETFEIDEARNGVTEARYKLLLDWIRNDDNGTLGHLATLLWEEGERHIVKELSIIYSKNK